MIKLSKLPQNQVSFYRNWDAFKIWCSLNISCSNYKNYFKLKHDLICELRSESNKTSKSACLRFWLIIKPILGDDNSDVGTFGHVSSLAILLWSIIMRPLAFLTDFVRYLMACIRPFAFLTFLNGLLLVYRRGSALLISMLWVALLTCPKYRDSFRSRLIWTRKDDEIWFYVPFMVSLKCQSKSFPGVANVI